MASGTVCQIVPDGPSSRPGEPKAANVSQPEVSSLKSSDDFRRVLAAGTRRRVGDITVVWAPGSAAHVRVGLVAGKRTGNAVQRNRAKRRLRQAVRGAGLPPGDYVVMAGASVVSAPFTDLVEWLSRAGKSASS